MGHQEKVHASGMVLGFEHLPLLALDSLCLYVRLSAQGVEADKDQGLEQPQDLVQLHSMLRSTGMIPLHGHLNHCKPTGHNQWLYGADLSCFPPCGLQRQHPSCQGRQEGRGGEDLPQGRVEGGGAGEQAAPLDW